MVIRCFLGILQYSYRGLYKIQDLFFDLLFSSVWEMLLNLLSQLRINILHKEQHSETKTSAGDEDKWQMYV